MFLVSARFWSQGTDCTFAVEIFRSVAAIAPGHDIKQLAKLGGPALKNCERDIHKHAAKQFGMKIQLYYVPTRGYQRTGSIGDLKLPMLLPHELLFALGQTSHSFLAKFLGVEKAPEFWKNTAAHPPRWVSEHEFKNKILSVGGVGMVPIKLFGDDAGFREFLDENSRKLLLDQFW